MTRSYTILPSYELVQGENSLHQSGLMALLSNLRCSCRLHWYARVRKFKIRDQYQEPEMVRLTPSPTRNGPGQVYGVHILLPTSKEIKTDIRVSVYAVFYL